MLLLAAISFYICYVDKTQKRTQQVFDDFFNLKKTETSFSRRHELEWENSRIITTIICLLKTRHDKPCFGIAVKLLFDR